MKPDEGAEAPSGDRLEPGVRRFVDAVTADARRGGGYAGLTPAEARRLAEAVRAPWSAGGPAMARVVERIAPGLRPVRVRIYEPRSGEPPGGALVYMHGGGWKLFSLDTHDRLMREYAARSGLRVVGVDYSLAPEARFPVALDEVVEVMRWLATAGPALDVDPDRLAIGGDSAGANLALAATLSLRDADWPARPRGLLLNYGCYDVAISPEAAARFGGPRFMLSAEEMSDFWQDYLRGPDDASNPLACPLPADLAGLPPALIAIAECDVLAEQNKALAERMTAAGDLVRAVVYAGASHSFLEAVSISALADRALAEASEWLRETCA